MDEFITLITRSISAIILGTLIFLFRHKLKSIFVDPSSNPKLKFGNRKTTLQIKVCDIVPFEKGIESKVNADMEKEYRIYAPTPLDPYRNPLLAVQDYSFQANMLNSCKTIYLDSREKFIRRMLCSDIINRKWQCIEIFIVNTGHIATKSMRVKINVQHNNLYPCTKIKENSGKNYQPPTGTERFHKDVFVTPDFYLRYSEYIYLTETDDSCVQMPKTYDITVPIRQGDDNRYKLDTFFIDTSTATEFDIEWNIYEDTLGKKGNHGVLKIKCIV